MASTPSPSRNSGAQRFGPYGLLAALAFIPPLRTAPGVLATDTKHYLTANPGRLLSTASSMWDPQQFGGFVTHQTIGYLWPVGPYYWLCDRIGLPDWIAQRLWLGLLFFAAGTGVLRLAKRFGLSATPALAAAVLYQLSPYVVTYANRTSVLLAPWAGLGWLLLFTMRAAVERSWRWPAAIALVVLTVGSINATALVLLAAGPLLWLVFAAHRGAITRASALATVARTGILTASTSLWWVVGLSIEGRFGAKVLSYSETVQAVSSTSSAAEVQRGLGYWLFYGGNASGRWNSASTGYLSSPGLIFLGFALFALAVSALVVVRHSERAFLGAMWAVGTVLAMGAYPPDNASLFGRILLKGGTIGLALRSSTRATPLVALAAALSVGLLLSHVRARRPTANVRSLANACAAVVMLAGALNLPALWNGTLVDRILRRPSQLPAAWRSLAADLNQSDETGSVLELPGQEFGAFTWGTTTDQPLPALTHRNTITRDLLPLGDAQRMDLLYALDDRLQNGVLESASLAPVARLLGVSDVVIRNDEAAERYGTPTTDQVARQIVGLPPGFGERMGFPPNAESPQLERFTVKATPDRLRVVSGDFVLVDGSGDGIVDAAASGLIDGTETIRYAADASSAAQLVEWVRDARLVLVTDSNRRRAHQWRGSQDVTGFTEDIDTAGLRTDPADARLPVFASSQAATQTIGDHRGGTVRATGYGPANAYWPEQRPVNAFDGDPTTWWMVGADGPVLEERIEAQFDQPVAVDGLTIRQRRGARQITDITVRLDDRTVDVTLDDRSASDVGQPLSLPGPPSRLVSVTIAGTNPGRLSSYFGQQSVALDVSLPRGERITEVVRLPETVGSTGVGNVNTSVVFTRVRVAKGERLDAFPGAAAKPALRRDPEQVLDRSFRLAAGGTFSGVADFTERGALAGSASAPCRTDVFTIDDKPIEVAPTGSSSRCAAITLAPGPHELRSSRTIEANRLVLRSSQAAPSTPTLEPAVFKAVTLDRRHHRFELPSVSEPTWVVVSDGFNEGWTATANGSSLGGATRVNSGQMAWKIAPSTNPVRVDITFGPQRAVRVALFISAVAALLCVALIAKRRQPRALLVHQTSSIGMAPRWAYLATAAGSVFVAPPVVTAAVVVLLVAALSLRRHRLPGLAAVALAGLTAVYATSIQLRHRPLAGFGWVHDYRRVHQVALASVLLLAASACARNDTG
jgi:arabinofuranan 3-O-arabinosyltransferase